jgi:peptidoglycan/xylan/chitin deacetylase (PgdA/CDA1 family)
MKKVLLIFGSILVIAALIVGYNLLYSNYRTATANAGTYETESENLKERITKLRAQRKKNNKYITGQKKYIDELTAQIAALESAQDTSAEANSDLTSTDDEDSDSSNDSDSSEEDDSSSDDYGEGDESGDPYAELYAQAEYDKKYSTSTEEGSGSEPTEKTIYLTFDDGPSKLTPQVLDLLDEYNAKATFFVVYHDEYKEYLSEVVSRGHTLALHSYSHDYDTIYDSVDAYLADFLKVYDWVYENTGMRPTLFRFPGGSMNGDEYTMQLITEEMESRGFIYYDWNVSSGDGSNLTTSENIIDNICDNAKYFDTPVVLMHDGAGKNATLNALRTVLQNLQNDGYSFDVIPENMIPIQYR